MVKLIKNEKFDFLSDFERRVAVSVLKTFLHGKKLRYLHDIRNTHIDFGEKILKCSTRKPKNVKKPDIRFVPEVDISLKIFFVYPLETLK